MFEEFAKYASDLYEKDTQLHEITGRMTEGIKGVAKMKRLCKSLKMHLVHIQERLKRDGQSIGKTQLRVSKILSEYRERCREGLVDYLKNLDLDVRRILKPLVPSSVVEENVKYPQINLNTSLMNSAASSKKDTMQSQNELDNLEDDATEEERLNSHINMLVNTLETVAKELMQLLSEANRTYYEYVAPDKLSSEPNTPLAAPLPEYFTFTYEDSEDDEKEGPPDQKSILGLKSKINKLREVGDLSTPQANKMKLRLEEMAKDGKANLNEIFVETDIPITKREELVFKLINTSYAEDVQMEEFNQTNKEASKKSTEKKSPAEEVQETKSTLKQPSEKPKEKRLRPHRPVKSRVEEDFYTPQAHKEQRFFAGRNSVVGERRNSKISRAKSNLKPQRQEMQVRSNTPVARTKKRPSKKFKSPFKKARISVNRSFL